MKCIVSLRKRGHCSRFAARYWPRFWMSASLIGPSELSTFRLSVSMPLAGSCFSPESALRALPLWDPSTRRNNFLGDLCRRQNLIQAEATARELVDIPLSDTTIREKILSNLKKQLWAHTTHAKCDRQCGRRSNSGHGQIRLPSGHQGCRRIHRWSMRGQRQLATRPAADESDLVLHRLTATSKLQYEAPGWQQTRRMQITRASRQGQSEPQPVLSKQFNRGCLRALFADFVGKHDSGADSQFGKRSVKNAVAVKVDLLAIA